LTIEQQQKKINNMEAYKEGIKHLTNEQLLNSREILYAELNKAEETVTIIQGKLKALI
jgi:bacterioferritin (cytochrome b1)